LRGSVLVAAVVTLAAVGLVLVANRPPAQPGLSAVLRTNGRLVVRQELLRTAARDLSEQVCGHIEQALPMESWREGSEGQAQPCPQAPSKDAASEEVLAWLSGQGALLEALATASKNEAPLVLDATRSGR
jgi:hypothetical protein